MLAILPSKVVINIIISSPCDIMQWLILMFDYRPFLPTSTVFIRILLRSSENIILFARFSLDCIEFDNAETQTTTYQLH